ncbi:MAG: hypothetical protein CVU89_02015 [Firmicutes bacterium HGW-Firmicutes-14]|nr:MAG: hypothetical protein CVU89_02015 [Firmicutes bacterium HGW-Firmicutes-14]
MTKKALSLLWVLTKTFLTALYLFVLYELLLIPAILDWSFYGVGLAIFLVGMLIWCIPADKRLSTTVLGVTFLLTVQALDNIKAFPMWKQAFGIIFIFFVLLVTGKLLGRFTLRRYIAFFVTALIINTALDMSQVPFWTEFTVKWQSPALYGKLAAVDYFPVTLADVDGDGADEIITQQNLVLAKQELQETSADSAIQHILEPEDNVFAVYKWNGDTFSLVPPGQYDPIKLAGFLPVDYPGFPLYKSSVTVKNGNIEQEMTPLVNRASLVEQAVDFGSIPFQMLMLTRESLSAAIENRPGPLQPVNLQPVQTKALARGDLVPGPPEETVAIDNNLVVREPGPDNKAIGKLSAEQVPDIGLGEILTGDVDSDKTDELLLTVEESRIMELSAEGRWNTLWANPEPFNSKTRFQKFRFEDFAPLGRETSPDIIALSKSNVRDNPTRYMTGYTYRDGTLHQKWRVFTGLINLRAGDIDGDGYNELVGYLYRGHRILVLEKHNIPVVLLLYLLTGGLILYGFFLRFRGRKPGQSGKLTAVFVLVLSVIFSGCAIQSGPREFENQPVPPLKPAPEAAEKLAGAFKNTVENGRKFMFSGWTVTRVQKRNTGFYATGSYDKSKGYQLDARVFGQPYRYYRWGSEVYVSEREKWRRADPSSVPLEPFSDFMKLEFPAGKTVKLPDEEVLGKNCDVYSVTLDSAEAIRAARAMGLEPGEPSGQADPEYFDRLQMKYTVWVGKDEDSRDDNFIYQFKSETTMPVPGAGSMYQEVFFKFWDYNGAGINLEPPEKKIKPYLVEEG